MRTTVIFSFICFLANLVNCASVTFQVETPNKPKHEIRVLMIVGDFSEDYEVMVPYQILRMLNISVHIVSPGKSKGDAIQTIVDDTQPILKLSSYTERFGHMFPINFDFDDISIADISEEYDGLLVPGGRAPEMLQLNEKVLDIVREFDRLKLPIASQCHGPQVLAAAGILQGRQCTGFIGVKPQLVASGCNYKTMTEDSAMIDKQPQFGPLITAPTWASHAEFMRLFMASLLQS